jgi:hypothetical protein
MKSALAVSIGLLLVASCSSSPSSAAKPSSSPSPASLLVKAGTGNYDSGPFSTTGNWEIHWSYDCSAITTGHDWLIVAVYRQSEADPTTASLFDSITPAAE